MHKRILPKLILAFSLFSIVIISCTKFDTTKLGADLIPVVDNINTFDTALDIISTQFLYPDSLVRIFRNSNQVLGKINNDPVFGKTEANMFFQFKPDNYPFQFLGAKDSLIKVDSVVLTLSYLGAYGDKSSNQTLSVSQVIDNQFRDSTYKNFPISYQPNTGPVMASTTFGLLNLGNYKKINNGKDSVKNQIRIVIADDAFNTSFMTDLFNRDTAANKPLNNAFRNDSLFRNFYNGFAVKATSNTSNAIMYISLTDAASRLEVHFRKKDTTNGIIDTVYKSLVLKSQEIAVAAPSTTANYISRDYSGTNVLSGSTTEHYLQTSPGTYLNLKIPGLTGLSNRIVHRASIIIEQTPTTALDTTFSVPPYLYLDLKDTGLYNMQTKWKPIYYDLNPAIQYLPDYNSEFSPYFPTNGVDQSYFGGAPRTRPDGRKYYDLNVTRYTQQIVTKGTTNYEMRVFAPYLIRYPQYLNSSYINYDNPPAFGRITVGSGTNPNYKLKMRIIYSKK